MCVAAGGAERSRPTVSGEAVADPQPPLLLPRLPHPDPGSILGPRRRGTTLPPHSRSPHTLPPHFLPLYTLPPFLLTPQLLTLYTPLYLLPYTLPPPTHPHTFLPSLWLSSSSFTPCVQVCLDGVATSQQEVDTVEVLKAIQKAKETKDRLHCGGDKKVGHAQATTSSSCCSYPSLTAAPSPLQPEEEEKE